MQRRGAGKIKLALFVSAACIATISPAYAQSDLQQSGLPEFSNPYGGATAYAHSGETTADPKAAKAPARKLAKKSVKKESAKKEVAKKASTSPAHGPSEALTQDPSAPRDTPTASASPTAHSDNPLSFGMKWSGSNNPTFSSGTSTIPAVNEIKRNANEDPVETGSGVQAGVNLKF